jgi:type IV pilus assembly protein PilF
MTQRRPLLCPILMMMFGLAACNQFTRNDQLATSKTSNEVALSNLNLGIEYMQQQEYEKSLEKLNKALAADPKYTPTYNVLGLLYQRLGKNEEAEQYFKRALSINANDPNTLNNYGQFLCSTKHYDEAQDLFMKAAADPLYETQEIALTNAGTCALHNNHPDVAESYFRQALEKNPRISTALLQMAQLSYTNGNYLSARAYLQRFLVVAPHTPASLWLGIQIERQLGDKNTLASYVLLLKNNFPDSRETGLLKESGIK